MTQSRRIVVSNMAQVEDIHGGKHLAIPYAQAARRIMSYMTEGAALDTEAPEAFLTEGARGGFILEGWYIPDGSGEYFGFRDVYVTIEDAKQLILNGLAIYRGYSDTFEEALATMADNETVKPGHVFAYGAWHEPLTYEQAYETCQWFTYHDVSHGLVSLARVSEDAFELVAFGEDSEGTRIGEDSVYVTLDVGRLLVLASVANVMVLAYNGDDLEDPETFDRLREEQLWG